MKNRNRCCTEYFFWLVPKNQYNYISKVLFKLFIASIKRKGINGQMKKNLKHTLLKQYFASPLVSKGGMIWIKLISWELLSTIAGKVELCNAFKTFFRIIFPQYTVHSEVRSYFFSVGIQGTFWISTSFVLSIVMDGQFTFRVQSGCILLFSTIFFHIYNS